jgi:hypothetical protein
MQRSRWLILLHAHSAATKAEANTHPPPLRSSSGAYQAHGTELTSNEIWVFVKANGIPYGRERGRLWAECVAEWKQQRAARGLAVPAGPPPLDERPDYFRAVDAARPAEQRRRDWSDIEDCLPHVVAYLEQLPSGARSSQRGYQAWTREQADAPASSSLDQHGGWGFVRELALQRLQSELPPESTTEPTQADDHIGRKGLRHISHYPNA